MITGVLLLNAGLTVRSGAANSHKDKGWETLTDAVIKWISENCRGVVFLLWGSYAQKKASVVDKVIICMKEKRTPSEILSIVYLTEKTQPFKCTTSVATISPSRVLRM